MSRHKEFIDHMDAIEEEYLRLEPRADYDPCVVGGVRQFNRTFLLYSTRRILEMHVRSGMSYEEAEEYFEFNTVGGWYGEQTFIFLNDHFDPFYNHDEPTVEETTEMT